MRGKSFSHPVSCCHKHFDAAIALAVTAGPQPRLGAGKCLRRLFLEGSQPWPHEEGHHQKSHSLFRVGMIYINK